MSQSSAQPEPKTPAEVALEAIEALVNNPADENVVAYVLEPLLQELEIAVERENFLYHQFRTQLRNLMLCYLHALTQSKYRLSFYENGAIKSISPRGWSE